MAKRMTITLLALLVVFGGIFGWKALQGYFIGQYFAHFQPPPVTVSAAPARSDQWRPYVTAVGSLTPVQGVDVSSEVPGMVQRIDFTSGATVRKGQLLLQLDDTQDQADLQGLQAQLTLARLSYQRAARLVRSNLSSKENLDTAQTQLREAEAAVASKQALIAKKAVTAPFDGTLGIRRVNLGEYLKAGSPIVNLQSLNPLYATFTLPEQKLAFLHVGQPVQVTVDTYPGRRFAGKVTAIDARVEQSSHSIEVQATLDNADLALRPGMFATVKILAPDTATVVAVPATAVTYTLYGDSVFIVHTDGKDKDGKPVLKVTRQFVKTGAERGDEVAITEGVKPGDQVVTAGQLKLETGSRVVIDNSVKLDAAAQAVTP